jgi:hypothetical protein
LAAGTAISAEGVLTVAANDPHDTLTIKAVSTAEASTYGMIAVLTPAAADGSFTNADDLAAYLSTAAGGTNPAAPLVVSLALDLSTYTAGVNAALTEMGKYVILDMNGCTVTGNTDNERFMPH